MDTISEFLFGQKLFILFIYKIYNFPAKIHVHNIGKKNLSSFKERFTKHKFFKILFNYLIHFVTLILFLTNTENIITLKTPLSLYFLPILIISYEVTFENQYHWNLRYDNNICFGAEINVGVT